MRDDVWLVNRMNSMWGMLFPEIPRENHIVVRFKGKWRNKFGHIKRLPNKDSEIVINSHFRNEIVPEYIIDLTLAHEMVHYMHGFNSPLPRQFKHPHAGGIVNRELRKRGFGHLIIEEKKWVRNEWPKLLGEVFMQKRRTRVSRGFGWFRF